MSGQLFEAQRIPRGQNGRFRRPIALSRGFPLEPRFCHDGHRAMHLQYGLSEGPLDGLAEQLTVTLVSSSGGTIAFTRAKGSTHGPGSDGHPVIRRFRDYRAVLKGLR